MKFFVVVRFATMSFVTMAILSYPPVQNLRILSSVETRWHLKCSNSTREWLVSSICLVAWLDSWLNWRRSVLTKPKIAIVALSSGTPRTEPRCITSLLTCSDCSIEMEVDPDKVEGDFDKDTNTMQLILVCQKMFSKLNSSIPQIPLEFRQIFTEIDRIVMNKFGSAEASCKAIGGFFYLRFVCPSVTAPHAYGLLPRTMKLDGWLLKILTYLLTCPFFLA